MSASTLTKKKHFRLLFFGVWLVGLCFVLFLSLYPYRFHLVSVLFSFRVFFGGEGGACFFYFLGFFVLFCFGSKTRRRNKMTDANSDDLCGDGGKHKKQTNKRRAQKTHKKKTIRKLGDSGTNRQLRTSCGRGVQ